MDCTMSVRLNYNKRGTDMFRWLALVIVLFAANAKADEVRVSDLSLVEEEANSLTAEVGPNSVMSGNFPNSIMDGNFPNSVMSGNFPDAVMDGNFPTSQLPIT